MGDRNALTDVHSGDLGADRLADEVRRRGAVIVREILDPALILRLRQQLADVMAEDDARFGAGHPFPGMVHALMTRGDAFLDVLREDRVRQIARAILGHGAIVHAYNSSSLPPRQSNYAGRIHVDSPRVIPGYATNLGLCFPVDDFTSANGAMEIWPESFEQAYPPDEETFRQHRVVLDDLRAGDVVVFNSRCWHQSGVNQTDAWRMAVTINCCRAFMRQQFDFPAMIPPEVGSTLSEDVRQFLGYHVQMPASLDEFLLPALERPYRPGQE